MKKSIVALLIVAVSFALSTQGIHAAPKVTRANADTTKNKILLDKDFYELRVLHSKKGIEFTVIQIETQSRQAANFVDMVVANAPQYVLNKESRDSIYGNRRSIALVFGPLKANGKLPKTISRAISEDGVNNILPVAALSPGSISEARVLEKIKLVLDHVTSQIRKPSKQPKVEITEYEIRDINAAQADVVLSQFLETPSQAINQFLGYQQLQLNTMMAEAYSHNGVTSFTDGYTTGSVDGTSCVQFLESADYNSSFME